MKGENEEKPPSKPPGRALKILEAIGGNVNDWYNWRWQLRHLIRDPELIGELLCFPAERVKEIKDVGHRYPILISPYYFSLINPDDPDDPILRQSIPFIDELLDTSGFVDPLDEEKDMPVAGLTHRYPDRVLLVLTNLCPTYCRFCTRKRLLGKAGKVVLHRYYSQALEYIRRHREIRDVVLSGGDPLTLPNSILRRVISDLSSIENVEVIRLGTRTPVTLPMRFFDDELLQIFADSRKLWVNTHFNHPNEFTPLSELAIRNIMKTGVPVNNQTVLLKGINDNLDTMRQLLRALLRNRVRPYYLFHCDPTEGVAHFRTSIWKGLEIIEGLRGHFSGLGVPTYVVDAPGGGGKIPIMPNYMLSASDDAIVLRNYEGLIIKYYPEGKRVNTENQVGLTGVSGLLEGNEIYIAPLSERLMRRGKSQDDGCEDKGGVGV